MSSLDMAHFHLTLWEALFLAIFITDGIFTNPVTENQSSQ